MKKITHLAVEQKTVVVPNKPTGNMVDVKLKLIDHLRHNQKAIDFLALCEFYGHLIINNPNIDLRILGFSLQPRASKRWPVVGLVRVGFLVDIF